MLLSQHIAIDKNFIRQTEGGDWRQNKYNKTFIPELRKKIMHATKLVVPNEFLSFDKGYDAIVSLMPTNKTITDRWPLYTEYSRLFAPILFIESDRAGVLLEERKGGWIATFICRPKHPDYLDCCALLPGRPIFNRNTTIEAVLKEVSLLAYGFTLTGKNIRGVEDATYDFTISAFTGLCELLLFVNVKNTPIRSYTPTPHENIGIPAEIIPKYTYKVLDIYRDLGEIKDLETVTTFLRVSPSGHSNRRAHLVRGHFKRKKNGLFWWNPFMRARDSATRAGVVLKDYNLKVND